jgi:hypothetical protein
MRDQAPCMHGVAPLRAACRMVHRGCCADGSSCTFLHRLPTEEDESYHCKHLAADIFGKEKRAEAEGYRKGAGEQALPAGVVNRKAADNRGI